MAQRDRKAYLAVWRAKNREKILKQNARWRGSPKGKASKRAYHIAHPEQAMESTLKRRAKNPRLRKEEYQRWKKAHPDGNPDKHLRDKYGIGIADYNRMFAEQDGRCAICNEPPKGNARGYKLEIDHCHKTGVIRSLLCRRCNSAVGFVETLRDRGLVEAVEKYLRPPLKIMA